jgi:thioredoxin reductase
VITDGEPIGDRPKLADDLSAVGAPGVFLAGDVTGLPLIKNAIRQGAQATENIRGTLVKHRAPLDMVIVGAGPAGISAALKAKELGLSYAIIDQGSVAQSIRSFPRGKLVFDQPLELPVAGKLWLAEATKEELLQKWMRIVREERIEVREQVRFTRLERDGDALVVHAVGVDDDRAHRFRCARLLLAVGVRGSPRKLPVPLTSATESKVFYHLADARSLSGRRVVVVGLGDVAMETAIALCHQPDCVVTVVSRGTTFSRGKSRNIEELRRLADAGRVDLRFSSVVAEVTVDEVAVDDLATGAQHRLANDVVFVMIGSDPPRALLERLASTWASRSNWVRKEARAYTIREARKETIESGEDAVDPRFCAPKARTFVAKKGRGTGHAPESGSS